jgi:hypothetical protein
LILRRHHLLPLVGRSARLSHRLQANKTGLPTLAADIIHCRAIGSGRFHHWLPEGPVTISQPSVHRLRISGVLMNKLQPGILGYRRLEPLTSVASSSKRGSVGRSTAWDLPLFPGSDEHLPEQIVRSRRPLYTNSLSLSSMIRRYSLCVSLIWTLYRLFSTCSILRNTALYNRDSVAENGTTSAVDGRWFASDSGRSVGCCPAGWVTV